MHFRALERLHALLPVPQYVLDLIEEAAGAQMAHPVPLLDLVAVADVELGGIRREHLAPCSSCLPVCFLSSARIKPSRLT